MFVDLFCGACNIVDKITTAKRRIANDNNPYLIELFKALQKGYEPPADVSEEEYKYTMSHLEEDKPLSGFVGIACSFAGGWNNGYARDTRTPHYYASNARNSLNRQRDKIDGVEFTCYDYDKLDIPIGSVIYCDPPYRVTTNKYYCRKFDYDKFIDWVEANKNRYDIYISEYERNVDSFPDTYEVVWKKNSRHELRGKNGRGKTVEVLIHAI